MKKKTFYQDEISGKQYESKKLCLVQESKSKAIRKMLAWAIRGEKDTKKPGDGDCDFANGKWSIQRDRAWVERLRKELAEAVNKYAPELCEKDCPVKEEEIGSYYWGRMLSDNGHYLYSYFLLFHDICKKCFRQYGQPYYANSCRCENTEIPTRKVS